MKRLTLTKENRLASIRDVDPKTRTSRVIVPQPTIDESGNLHYKGYNYGQTITGKPHFQNLIKYKAPYQVGDIFCMPEPYKIQIVKMITKTEYDNTEITTIEGEYQDDLAKFKVILSVSESKKFWKRKKPYMNSQARFMYDSLIRHFFKVTKVRVEQVQDISWQDCKKEGWPDSEKYSRFTIEDKPRRWFETLWDSINKKRGYGWDKNPWNFIYNYERSEVKDGWLHNKTKRIYR